MLRPLVRGIKAIRSAETLSQLIAAKKYFNLAVRQQKPSKVKTLWSAFGLDEFRLKSQSLEGKL